MLEKAQAFPDRTTASDLELHSINPGQIADLCKLQARVYQEIQQHEQNEHRQMNHGQQRNQMESSYGNVAAGTANDNADEDAQFVPLPPYTPINPFTMPISGGLLLDRAEPGRLDVRMRSLRQELKAFGYAPATGR